MPVEVGAAGGIVTSSISLPSDFDSTTSGGRQVYVGWDSGLVATDDVYRIDDNFTRKLGIQASVGIRSVSFSGSRAEGGTMIAGESVRAYVWHSANPETSIPTWKFS
jgi:hypothetical protein